MPGVTMMPAMNPRDMPGDGGMGMPMAEMALASEITQRDAA